MDIKEIDKYIERYFLAPYRIRILESRIDYELGIKGKCSPKYTQEINSLYEYREKIENIIGADDLPKLQILILENKIVYEEFNLKKHQAWTYRKRIRNKIVEAINTGEIEVL